MRFAFDLNLSSGQNFNLILLSYVSTSALTLSMASREPWPLATFAHFALFDFALYVRWRLFPTELIAVLIALAFILSSTLCSLYGDKAPDWLHSFSSGPLIALSACDETGVLMPFSLTITPEGLSSVCKGLSLSKIALVFQAFVVGPMLTMTCFNVLRFSPLIFL